MSSSGRGVSSEARAKPRLSRRSMRRTLCLEVHVTRVAGLDILDHARVSNLEDKLQRKAESDQHQRAPRQDGRNECELTFPNMMPRAYMLGMLRLYSAGQERANEGQTTDGSMGDESGSVGSLTDLRPLAGRGG